MHVTLDKMTKLSGCARQKLIPTTKRARPLKMLRDSGTESNETAHQLARWDLNVLQRTITSTEYLIRISKKSVRNWTYCDHKRTRRT
jgi:hypothetical protein